MMKLKRQLGAAMVEFAIAALPFFMIIFGILEFGRWMFLWNSLDEATRRGARVAAVCKADATNTYIKQVTLFGNSNTGSESPILSGLTTDNVTVEYFSNDYDPDNKNASKNSICCLSKSHWL